MGKKSTENWASFFDHTALKPDTTTSAIDKLCDEALEYGFKGVCTNSCYVEHVAKRLDGSESLPVAVVGFPLGAAAADAKAFETSWVIEMGAREIDTVVNLGAYKSGDELAVRRDLSLVVEAAGPDVPVKVILETGYLNPEEIAQLTGWCVDAGAAFIKTSTGMGPRGATIGDIKIIRSTLESFGPGAQSIGIKASGGIRDAEFMRQLIEAGATRIGASASVNILGDL